VVTRALPVLLAMFLALFAAPHSPAPSVAAPRIPAASSAVTVAAGSTADVAAPSMGELPDPPAAPVVVDRAAVLFAQFAAGVRGSRAPPAALA
jgi:hypothetical protein